MTSVPTSGPSMAIEDFRSQIKAAERLEQTHERAFVLANIAAAPGDIAVAIQSKNIRDAQMPIFGSLPLRMSRYYDKEAMDYKKRLLSNCKSKFNPKNFVKIKI